MKKVTSDIYLLLAMVLCRNCTIGIFGGKGEVLIECCERHRKIMGETREAGRG